MTARDLLTVSEIAAELKVNEETVRQWLRRHEIKGYNLRGRSGWRVPAAEVDGFLEARSERRPARTILEEEV